MAKEIAITKRAKISEAQQYMLLAVLGASIFLGVAICLVSHFVKQISFNTQVIMAEEESIAKYSNIIKTTGICKKPSGSIYTDAELKNCNPDSIDVTDIPDTLRSNILEDVASNAALNSVDKEENASCINPSTNKNYTYAELSKNYAEAQGSVALSKATKLIESCSALRVIPDALPAYQNADALGSSLNKIFNESGWEPTSFSVNYDTEKVSEDLNSISVSLSIESDSATTLKVLNNIERSIRQFDISRATIEWGGNDALLLQATASAYFMNESSLTETTKTIKAEGNKTKK